jgi:hypothetical protein
MRRRHTGRERKLRAVDSFPTRWVELGSTGSRSSPEENIQRRVGALLGKVPAPPGLGRAAHGRVAARLLDPERSERTWTPSWIPSWSPRWIGRLAMGSGLAAFSLFVGGAVIAAGGVGAWWKIARPRVPSSSPPIGMMAREEVVRNARRHPRPQAVARVDGAEVFRQATPQPVPPLETPPPGPPSDVAPAATSRPAAVPRSPAPASVPRIAPRASAPELGPSELAQETRLLRGALAELRQQHDGAAALATLNEYLQHFPKGTLLAEARRARVDALLLLGRSDEAQGALDRLELEPVGRGQELLLIRGELRARRDCADAIADFDVVVGHAAPPRLAERALFGRAVCRQHEGQRSAARADALAYLERFPAGRFAESARRLVVATVEIPLAPPGQPRNP